VVFHWRHWRTREGTVATPTYPTPLDPLCNDKLESKLKRVFFPRWSIQARSLGCEFAGPWLGTVGISLIHSCASLIRVTPGGASPLARTVTEAARRGGGRACPSSARARPTVSPPWPPTPVQSLRSEWPTLARVCPSLHTVPLGRAPLALRRGASLLSSGASLVLGVSQSLLRPFPTWPVPRPARKPREGVTLAPPFYNTTLTRAFTVHGPVGRIDAQSRVTPARGRSGHWLVRYLPHSCACSCVSV